MSVKTESDKKLREILGNNIRKYRKIKGFSQGDLAEILDISPNFISDMETGKRWLSSDTLVNLAESLGVEAHELLKPEEIPTEETALFIQNYTQKASVAVANAVNKSLNELQKQFI